MFDEYCLVRKMRCVVEMKSDSLASKILATNSVDSGRL